MPTLDEVKRQIQAYPHRYVFWTEKEIKKLPKILDDDERILAVTSGLMNKATWLLVLTQERLLFLNCGMFFGVRLFQVSLDRVQSIDSEFSIAFGSISVWDGASSFRIGMVLKSSIMPFVRATENTMQEYKEGAMRRASTSTTSAAPSQPSAPVDIASQIAKLAQLKENGYLTEEEFQAQKKKLLS